MRVDFTDSASIEQCIKFMQSRISVEGARPPAHLQNIQKHHCTPFYCKNNKRKNCRFNAPRMPTTSTKVLLPFGTDELTDARKARLQELRTEARAQLSKHDKTLHLLKQSAADATTAEEMTAAQFISGLGCTEDEYLRG